MKVSEFVQEYKAIRLNEKMTSSLIEKSIKENIYIPYLEKVTLATRIANATMIDATTQLLNLNTPAKFVLSVMSILYATTLLEQTDSENSMSIYSDYDALNNEGLIEILLENPTVEKEYKEFNIILQMISDDLISNKYDSHNFTYEIVGMVTNGIVKVLEPLSPALDKILNLSDEERDNLNKNFDKVINKMTK